MLLLAVDPFLDELLRGIVVGKGRGHLAHNLHGLGIVVALNLLLGVVVEGELYGFHGFLQLGGLAAEFHQAVEHLFGLVPSFRDG